MKNEIQSNQTLSATAENEINQFLAGAGFAPKTTYLKAAKNIFKDENGYTIKLFMPEVSADTIRLNLNINSLEVFAESKCSDELGEPEKLDYEYGMYKTTIQLNSKTDAAHITYVFNCGVLTIFIPVFQAKPSLITALAF